MGGGGVGGERVPAGEPLVTSVTVLSHLVTEPLVTLVIDFGDFGVSFTATVAGRYTRRGDPRDLILW